MPATAEQLDSAFMYGVDFARTMLEDGGEFIPFGAKINATGKLEAVGGWNGEGHPKRGEIYELILSALETEVKSGNALALAVAADVTIPAQYDAPFRDGLRVTLAAQDYARFIYVPYHLTDPDAPKGSKGVEFAEPFADELRSQR